MIKETSIGAIDTGPGREINSEFINSINSALEENNTDKAAQLAKSLHYADLADQRNV